MARWLRSRSGVPTWSDVREALAEAAATFPATTFAIAGADDTPAVAWTDGPSGDHFADAAGEFPGWTLMAGDPGGDVGVGGPVLFVRRDLSDAALAVAVVRYYAATGRHWSATESQAGRDTWRAITDVDDPGACAYPIPRTMAQLLLDTPAETAPPAGAGTPERADAMARRLAGVGYEKLWSIAFAAVP